MAAQPGLLRLPQLSASGHRTAREGRWQLASSSVRLSVRRRRQRPGLGPAPAAAPARRSGTLGSEGRWELPGPGPARRAALGPRLRAGRGGTGCAGTPRGSLRGAGEPCRLPAATEFLRPFARRASFRKVAALPATRSPGSTGTIETSRLDSPCPRGRRRFACGLVAGSSHCPSSLTDKRPPLSSPRPGKPLPRPLPRRHLLPPVSRSGARRGQRRRRGNGRERAGEGERERGAKLSPPSLPPSLPSSSLPPSLAPSPAPSLRSFCFSPHSRFPSHPPRSPFLFPSSSVTRAHTLSLLLVFLSFDFTSQGSHRLLYESRLLICHPPSTPVPSQLHSCTWSEAGAAAEQHVPKETEQTQADQT